jgi:cell division protein FtsX
MTPTTQGFAWEGFFRALQGDIMSLVGGLLFVLAAWLMVRWLIGKARRDDLDTAHGRLPLTTANRVALIVAAVIVGGFVWRAISVTSVNRMPRADLDKSGVYQQMDSNIQKH